MSREIGKCPFCKGIVYAEVCDDEGNHHSEEYENDPWSGLGYKIKHSIADNPGCPIATYPEDGAHVGAYTYDTYEEAGEAWNSGEKCVCGNEMQKVDWKNKWVCHRCGRTKPIKITLYDYIIGLSVYDMADFLSEFIYENTCCPYPYEILELLTRPYKQEEEK